MPLMQVYVQKATRTTRPRREASDSGALPAVLNQSSVSVNSGAVPTSFRPAAIASRLAWLALCEAVGVEELGLNLASCPVISCRRLSTTWDFSRLAVRFT